jgi:DAK2 domain fusion protein YloV
MQPTRQNVQSLDGDEFRRLIGSAARCLEHNADAINALNVFPVPDGDTGVNMLLTMRDLVKHVDALPPKSPIGQVTTSMARGALLGARGNSGVILSQFFQGLAMGLENCDFCSTLDLARAFQKATESSYKAVGKPVEGTMLTVIRAASEAANEAANIGTELVAVWQLMRDAAVSALARTPEQLPILRDAGVVDAGGQGIVALLEGGLAHLHGRDIGELAITVPADGAGTDHGQIDLDYLLSTSEDVYGYCTSFTITGDGLDIQSVRDHISSIAESSVVVGDKTLIKVHIHAIDPGPIISYAASLGILGQVSIQNMDEQNKEFITNHKKPEHMAIAVIAISSGTGIENVFRSLGASIVVRGGQTINPSVQHLLDAARKAGASDIVILPNNPNVILTALQASQVDQQNIHVVHSRSIPQGIAALLAFKPETDIQHNLTLMHKAISEIRSGEVTIAIRAARLEGKEVKIGQAIGLLDGELVCVADTPLEALDNLLDHIAPPKGSLATLYWGDEIDALQAEVASNKIAQRFSDVEVELIYGGQPFYHFLVSVE